MGPRSVVHGITEWKRRRQTKWDADRRTLTAQLEAWRIENRFWRHMGISDDEWPLVQERWYRDPELIENYPLGLMGDARLRSLLLAGEYVALRSAMDRVIAEKKLRTELWYRERAKCPRCRIGLGAHVVYGLLRGESLDAAKRAGVILAGCLLVGAPREWHCKLCGYEWGKRNTQALMVQGTESG
jgi:hypothetical protein